MNLFLKAAVYVGSPVGVLLREIFSGGPTISLKIKEEQIIHMMHLVFAKEKSEISTATRLGIEGKAAMIVALQELVKVCNMYTNVSCSLLYISLHCESCVP